MGRKPFIVGGLGLCSASLVLMSLVGSSSGSESAVQLGFTVGALGLVRPSHDSLGYASLTVDCESQGVGTTMMYSNLLAAVADEVSPTWRASALGTYRFWRDSGYFIGAMASGAMADAFDQAERAVGETAAAAAHLHPPTSPRPPWSLRRSGIEGWRGPAILPPLRSASVSS